MHFKFAFRSRAARISGVLLLSLILFSSSALAQQSYVGRWDVFGGFTNIWQPSINLSEPGFNFQAAMRPNAWITLGFDYSIASGRNTLDSGMLIPSLANQLGTQLGQLQAIGLVPANYALTLPSDIRTQTFEMGPDIPFRHFQSVTFFVRPNLGAIQAVATPRPADPIQTAIVSQLAPSRKKTDWTYFYGFGGGFEVNMTNHFAVRFQADFVHDQMFNDILKAGNTVRFSVGPSFQFGKNVAGR